MGKLLSAMVFVTENQLGQTPRKTKLWWQNSALKDCPTLGLTLGALSGYFMRQDFPLVTISISLKTRKRNTGSCSLQMIVFLVEVRQFSLCSYPAVLGASHLPPNLETESPLLPTLLVMRCWQGLSPLTMSTSTSHPDSSPGESTDWFHKHFLKVQFFNLKKYTQEKPYVLHRYTHINKAFFIVFQTLLYQPEIYKLNISEFLS